MAGFFGWRTPPLRMRSIGIFCTLPFICSSAMAQQGTGPAAASVDRNQVPSWSEEDLRFFLHGSMSTEVVPVNVLRAFRATYPQLLPGKDLSVFGLIEDSGGELPIGLSRREVPHLGGLSAVGINCASCHVARIEPAGGGEPVRVLGVTSHFNAEAFFGSILAGTFQTAEPDQMSRFLKNYLEACDPQASAAVRELLAGELQAQADAIRAALSEHLLEERSAPAGRLYELDRAGLTLTGEYLQRSRDLRPVVRSLLRLFHNMRAALHVPHQPPENAPPMAGPGRNNAFGVLSIALFGEPILYGPAKFGVAWNLKDRTWVHWDGNTRSPIVRNLAASLGLGAPLDGRRATLDFALVERHTRLSEEIRAPRYPWKIDAAAAGRGRRHFETHCALCHVKDRAGEDARLYAIEEVKTDPNRARMFDAHQAGLYNRFFSELKIAGYKPSPEPPVRSTGKYLAVDLAGVWARSPYLHNGSVRTMMELLKPAAERSPRFHRGSQVFDPGDLGYTDGGAYLFDTATEGNSNSGHEYGARELSRQQKRELIEYLKTL